MRDACQYTERLIGKVHFWCQKVNFLGHVISQSGIQQVSEKNKHVRGIPPLQRPQLGRHELSLHGLASYYRIWFVVGFST